MRPVIVSAVALGNSPWGVISYLQNAFAVGLAAIPTSGASLTYKVQHTLDDLSLFRPAVISRTTTVATVTDADHRASVGDSVTIVGSGDPNLEGTFDIASIVDANTYTYTVSNTGLTASVPGTTALRMRVFDHAVMTGLTTRSDGNYAFPVQAVRLKVTSYTSGKVDLIALQGMGR